MNNDIMHTSENYLSVTVVDYSKQKNELGLLYTTCVFVFSCFCIIFLLLTLVEKTLKTRKPPKIFFFHFTKTMQKPEKPQKVA